MGERNDGHCITIWFHFCRDNKHFRFGEKYHPLQRIHLTNNWDYASFSSAAKKEDSQKSDNNGSSSFSLVIRYAFDGREDGRPFFNLGPSRREPFFMNYQ